MLLLEKLNVGNQMDLIVGDDIAAKQTSSSGGCSSGTNMYVESRSSF